MDKAIPQTLLNFRVYLEGDDLIGVADVELPDLEPLTVEVKGAGVAGVVDSPLQGHFASMTVKLNWRTITGNVTLLAAPKAHQLDIRGSMQEYDTTEGKYVTVAAKLVLKAVPKKTGLGKMDAGEKMEPASEFEVLYLKLKVGEDERIELDKFGYKCVIEGTDYLEGVRKDLGL